MTPLSSMTPAARIRDRLHNWKFRSALNYAKEEKNFPPDKLEILESLNRMFTNCGWFDGDLAIIVRAAVDFVLFDEFFSVNQSAETDETDS